MSEKRLIKGNEALAVGAVHGGCDSFFGYPITPQNEVPEILSYLMPEHGRVFVQAESEVASINMVYGAAACGKRAMTSSSSPGVSLMMEGVSYIAGAELPCVIINVMRGGPGLGNIAPSQSDYFQAVKGGGHGDYHCIVLAPWNAQEMYEFPGLAFELADKYRNPVFVLTDAVLGSMIEPASVPEKTPEVSAIDKPWSTAGRGEREHSNVVHSLFLDPEELSDHNEKLQARYRLIQAEERRSTMRFEEDAEWLIVAYGIGARIALSAIKLARAQGLKIGLFRPISLFPFPDVELRSQMERTKGALTFELSSGQMVEDVRLTAPPNYRVDFFGKMGGVLPTPPELCEVMLRFAKEGS
ncbi:3-methyl-2-oxobutanoate dehydrogenase subunit VorB [Oligoflexia bacterium]|nr:3-methyl-2-oxobutanoate dehydrogenase subunit VorB [Oligoflexia bacterium]